MGICSGTKTLELYETNCDLQTVGLWLQMNARF